MRNLRTREELEETIKVLISDVESMEGASAYIQHETFYLLLDIRELLQTLIEKK